MKKDTSLTLAISEISLDKDIDKDLIVQTIEKTIVDAAKKKYPQYSNIEAQFDDSADMIHLYYYKTVTKDVTDENNEISIQQAKEVDSEAQLDDEISYEIEEEDYGNIIAQTARQGFFQKINELENSLLIEKYTDQIGEIVHGTVGQVNKNRSIIHLKKNVSAILDSRDAIPFEKLTSGETIKALLKEIDEKDSKKKFLKLSRTHPDFLLKLLKLEIPEVDDKTIEVLAVARDPGRRAKIAVKTNNPDVDPVGSCVGRGGERIQTVVNELNGERIDVIKWSEDIKQFIVAALVPAEIDHIDLNTENNIANVFINDQNLALAIGKRGQNVRLASQLTQFELNIRMLEETKSESEETIEAGKEEAVPEIDLFGDDSTQKTEETVEEKITASNDASKSISPIKKTTLLKIILLKKLQRKLKKLQKKYRFLKLSPKRSISNSFFFSCFYCFFGLILSLLAYEYLIQRVNCEASLTFWPLFPIAKARFWSFIKTLAILFSVFKSI